MKKLFLLTLIIPLLFACNTGDPVTMLSGTATNVEDGYFILGGPGGAKDTIILNDENNFDFEIKNLEKSANYYVSIEKEFLRFLLD